MCTAFQTASSGADTSVRLCSLLPFDHYQSIRNAIDAASPVRMVIFDFGDLPTIPTWIVGFILHLEDSRKLTIRLKNANAAVADMLNLAGLERLFDGRTQIAERPPSNTVFARTPETLQDPLEQHWPRRDGGGCRGSP